MLVIIQEFIIGWFSFTPVVFFITGQQWIIILTLLMEIYHQSKLPLQIMTLTLLYG